ncbi:sulfotransferase domain-containing protein [Marimonas arenosa]|uniref:Sulfotransferase domain-containing protein n=1 Tax=Marimonas arenosa TaxID=1795305 RepID=A0AAE4B775_9RHOB|nr:sulfotransferase domain-containing protein [Marimonas arenosa]MDQ2091176.1 sulfotransferase domain-containing protein [Marimonas arenosa]
MQKVRTERLRDYVGPVTNTDIWEAFELRSNDVIVCTPPKCGTTWTLNIVMMLIHGKVVPEAGGRDEAPWLDCGFRDRKAIAAKQASLTRRRCLKSHTPMDGISYGAEPTYIVVYRHPVDAHFSFRSHVENMKDSGPLAEMFPEDIQDGFCQFLDGPLTDAGTDIMTVSSIVHHYRQARAREDKGNVHFFHYADLSRDLHGQIERIADILKIDLSSKVLAEITEANTFASMRKVAEASENRFAEASPFVDQAKFFASGTSNKWKGRLSDDDIASYYDRCASLLSPEDAAWLNWGEHREP